MPRKKITFNNKENTRLAGMMELPEGSIEQVALFAHCFTCSKDIAAATRISRALSAKGIAVLRFDFTGLGNSDGDFANTNFSSNIQDLISAATYLEQNYHSPSLLIGHSLGGAAVLAAANFLPEVKAIVTIGAPATTQHLSHMFVHKEEEINANESADVDLAGRKFTIKKQFLDDIKSYNNDEHISQLNRALLVFHSPMDLTVSINEAAKIYSAAKHPKSFISLDNADHLLTNPTDAEYVATTMTAWVNRYLTQKPANTQTMQLDSGQVFVGEENQNFTRKIVTENHQLIADEPRKMGGLDKGPSPYEYLLSALGACTSMTLRMYAKHKKWPLKDVDVLLTHNREHAKDCDSCADETSHLETISRKIRISGDLSEEQRQKLLIIANKCPVHKTLKNDLNITASLVDEL